jgi:uncharacterized protein (UPF0261 family)
MLRSILIVSSLDTKCQEVKFLKELIERRSAMENDIEAEIARKSAEVLQKIKADSRLSHYVPADRVPSVFMGTDDKRD